MVIPGCLATDECVLGKKKKNCFKGMVGKCEVCKVVASKRTHINTCKYN